MVGFLLIIQPQYLMKIALLCPAQYATTNETPALAWKSVKTQLKDLDPTKLHYVKVPVQHIVIDFDLKKDGQKDFQKNYEAASKCLRHMQNSVSLVKAFISTICILAIPCA